MSQEHPLDALGEISLDLAYDKLLAADTTEVKAGRWDAWIKKVIEMERNNRAIWRESQETKKGKIE
jgi:hypothetical protein